MSANICIEKHENSHIDILPGKKTISRISKPLLKKEMLYKDNLDGWILTDPVPLTRQWELYLGSIVIALLAKLDCARKWWIF